MAGGDERLSTSAAIIHAALAGRSPIDSHAGPPALPARGSLAERESKGQCTASGSAWPENPSPLLHAWVDCSSSGKNSTQPCVLRPQGAGQARRGGGGLASRVFTKAR